MCEAVTGPQPLLLTNDVAVSVQNAFKSYRVGYNRSHLVIRGLNMSVQRGTIYGLLGPSGCGKTTLFRCIVGTVEAEQGAVSVFGHRPASKNSGVPGPQVGYMPQEVALYDELTIWETWHFYGFIGGMSRQQIKDRAQFMAEFLQLEPINRIVGRLSGGQKRRVSFATALLHQPPLLILDEPTVGVDPLLRSKIWQHLTFLAETAQTTIIISTHYIEEAATLNTVGLMSNGRMLVEAPPHQLLKSMCVGTLEEVFYKLCLKQQEEDEEEEKSGPELSCVLSSQKLKVESNSNESTKESKRSCLSAKRMLATTAKTALKFYRHPGVLLFAVILPAIQMLIAVIAIGGNFQHLPLAIVNEDSKELGQRFIDSLDQHLIQKMVFVTFEDGYASAASGDSCGLVHIGQNFTDSLLARFSHGILTGDHEIAASTINVSLDLTNVQVALTVKRALLITFETFAKSTLKRNGFNEMALSLPINWMDNVHGNEDQPFSHFVSPGLMISIAYFIAMGLTALAFVMEQQSGQWERGTVAGVTALDHVMGHMLAHFAVLLLQELGMFSVVFGVFHIPLHGSIVLAYVLVLAQGMCGMAFGVLVGGICKQENTAIMMVIGVFYPCIVLNGSLWPLEALPRFLRYISLCLPQTYATQALRAIITKGWGMTYPVVYIGFGITFTWLIIYVVFATIVFKLKQ